LKLTICLGSLLAPWLIASANVPATAQALNLDTVVTLPFLPGTSTQSVLRSFDISFVDGDSHYALASSALSPTGTGTGPTGSQPGVVTIDTKTHSANLLAVGKFAGSCSIPPARDDFSGPNGLVIIGDEIWVGDGPIYSPSCAYPGNPSQPTGTLVTPSSVKVLDFSGKITHVISTGGKARADELCFNPFTNTVLVANDDTLDSFITFISTETYTPVGSIKFDGTDKKGNNIVANGIEQCAFNPRDKKFYLNIPVTDTNGPGVVLTISEHAPFHVERVFTIDVSTGCVGPQGLAVGPSNEFALGCGGANSLVIASTNGKPVATVKGEGGTDEAWYGPASNQYYFARSTAGVLGVANAGPPSTAVSPDTKTAVGSHSVAADPNQKRVFVPIRSSTFSPGTTICGSKGGVNTLGCVAVYDSP
jgi:hypothetical protein